jgi:hypothetical protein
VIYKSALVAAAVLALVAIATGKTIRAQRMVTLGGLKYEITRYSDDTMEVEREDGLRFSVGKDGKLELRTGTSAQLEDAAAQMRATFLADLTGAGA